MTKDSCWSVIFKSPRIPPVQGGTFQAILGSSFFCEGGRENFGGLTTATTLGIRAKFTLKAVDLQSFQKSEN
jgi:hypothetical protein